MLVTFIRTLIIIITLIVLMRLMGKRQIGEMQPFEFIVTLIIADLACIPMADVSIPLVYGIVSIACLFILHQVFSLLEQRGKIFKRIISGKPSIVINKEGVDVYELKKNNLGVDDLIETMRSLGYFALDDLAFAIYETNGNLSALQNPNKPKSPPAISLLIVDNGKINFQNARILNRSKEQILQFILSQNDKLEDLEVMTIDELGRVYYKRKKKKFEILFLNQVDEDV